MHFVRAIPPEFAAVYANAHHFLKRSRSFQIRKITGTREKE